MPATAGRVRMPANNRVHSSAALQTHGIWQSAIGYDPYAPNKEDSKNASEPKSSANEPDADNPYNSYQGLLALARITNTNADEARGACKKCGRVGHLTFQCRNFLSIKDDNKEKVPEAIQAAVLSELEKIKGKVRKVNGKVEDEHDTEEEEEEESDSSDSDVDSEIERIIAVRYGKKVVSKGRSMRKKKMDHSDEDGSGKREKRGRSKKRSVKRGNTDSEDEEEVRRKNRKEKRRKRDESSDEDNEFQNHRRKSRKEKRRRRSQRHSDDSDSNSSEDSGRRYERKSRRSESPSDLDASGSDDSRIGRSKKRSKKKSRRRHHKEDK